MTEALVVPLRLSPAQALELVEKELPAKSSEYRRIHVIVEGSCFRVNFHDSETNRVVRSFFARLKGGKLTY
jgi:hypothetical protein